jgi:hypothetical protein
MRRMGNDERFFQDPKMQHHQYLTALGLASLLIACTLGGCTTTSDPSESQKQDQIMSHPMDYKPTVNGNITGGDTGNFDSGSFNHDVHDFWNP